MIGLGSNRLSVCRRGGMRVTQAGRGGMEWLAGGRVPSWANPYLPYSKAAGEALVAQFPTQWPTIRDYGFAHPALVPFINEDPMMVMSLIEGLGTRWYRAKSGATTSAKWEIPSFGYNDTMIIKFRYKNYANVQWPSLYSEGTPIQYVNMIACQGSGGSIVYRIGDGSSYSDYRPISFSENTLYTIEIYQNGFKLNGGTRYQHNVRTQFDTTTFPNMAFIMGNMGYEFYYAEHWRNGELIHKYFPQGDNAILDIVEAVAYPSTNGNKPYEFVTSPS